MGDFKHTVYGGSNTGLNPNYGKPLGGVPFSQFGQAINAQTANQLNEVSRALNTGLKTVEVQLTFPQIERLITAEHLEEVNRLRKLTGAKLTLHGPMVDAAGVAGGQEGKGGGGWSEQNRIQAERRIWSAIQKGKKIDPDGNLVVTLHASAAIPEEETKHKTKDGKEVITHIGAVDTQRGAIGMIPVEEKDFLEGKNKPEDFFKRINETGWFKQLQNLGHHANIGAGDIHQALAAKVELPPEVSKKYGGGNVLGKAYADFVSGKLGKRLEGVDPAFVGLINQKMAEITRGDLFLHDAYADFRDKFSEAYKYAKEEGLKDDLAKLDAFKRNNKEKLEAIKNPANIAEFGDVLLEGVNLLRGVAPPQFVRPIKDFAKDKASDTFSNVAFNSFKKYGDKSPIISLENHPFSYGTAFNRAENLRALIEETRDKFVEKAVKEGFSKSEAKQQAEKLIGVTWDVGHINTMRQAGYDEKDIAKQTKVVAPYIKHMHLADNLGLEDAELAMGQGNVPIKEHEKMLKKYGKMDPKEIKRIVEAFDSVSQFGGASPLPSIVSFYGSPVYQVEGKPYWNQQSGMMGNYYSGYGQILPDISWRNYGASFSALPADLGGGVGGAGHSGLTGTPMT